MANSILQTGPGLLLKVALPNGEEKLIGYASGLNYTVTQGQKKQMVVDTPFVYKIEQGAAASMVAGRVDLYVPKNFSLEAANLVVPRQGDKGEALQVGSKDIHIRIYDRLTGQMVFAANYCKISQYSFSVQSRQIAKYNLSFEGIHLQPGTAI